MKTRLKNTFEVSWYILVFKIMYTFDLQFVNFYILRTNFISESKTSNAVNFFLLGGLRSVLYLDVVTFVSGTFALHQSSVPLMHMLLTRSL